MSVSPAAGGTKKAAKVDRDAEIDALRVTKKWIGKDKIRAALKVTVAGFGCGVYQVVKLYESTATDARTL